jgi:hypothetical protein
MRRSTITVPFVVQQRSLERLTSLAAV